MLIFNELVLCRHSSTTGRIVLPFSRCKKVWKFVCRLFNNYLVENVYNQGFLTTYWLIVVAATLKICVQASKTHWNSLMFTGKYKSTLDLTGDWSSHEYWTNKLSLVSALLNGAQWNTTGRTMTQRRFSIELTRAPDWCTKKQVAPSGLIVRI